MNNDPRLPKQEHPALVLIEYGKLMGFRVMDLFNSLDKDGDRLLDREEIHKGLKVAGHCFNAYPTNNKHLC